MSFNKILEIESIKPVNSCVCIYIAIATHIIMYTLVIYACVATYVLRNITTKDMLKHIYIYIYIIWLMNCVYIIHVAIYVYMYVCSYIAIN